MKLSDVIDNLTKLFASIDEESFIYEFLAAFGTPKATLARLKSGNLNVAKKAGCILLKSKVYFEPVFKDLVKSPSPKEIVEAAAGNPQIKRNKPRFLFSTNFKEFVAYDTKRKEWLEVAFSEVGDHYTFFLPLAGMEETTFQEETDADVRAAEQMAKLYDLILADNPPSSKAERHQLNVFLTRLLFCYFAEDTEIFPDRLFTKTVQDVTQSDGSDVGELLQDIFLILNTKETDRKKPREHLEKFPYVNGGLFNDTSGKRSTVPQFTSKSRLKLIELGTKSWKDINPDIFGSMFQAVVDAEVRADLGMHYTSVPNIMKVIKPLFLDDLYEEFEKAKGSESKLNSLLGRIYRLRIFDPACGSGNFLIIAYKELRRLEMAVFKELQKLTTQLPLSGIQVGQFCGIEMDDFAHEVAILAMWLAEHQMNVEFRAEFGRAPSALPLKDAAQITHGNSITLKWEDVCEGDGDVYVLGNPPYQGARKQTSAQKQDLLNVGSHIEGINNLDYIGAFFLKASDYTRDTGVSVGFVSTNSICQGEQVPILWGPILKKQVEIHFAHQAFTWKNNAKAKAGVTCVIIGVRKTSNKPKWVYKDGVKQRIGNISPYLIEAPNTIIHSRRTPICEVPPVVFGNMPNDRGFLLLNRTEHDLLIERYPEAKAFIRRLLGAEEFIDNKERFCLWIKEDQLETALNIPEVKRRVEEVKRERLKSDRASTKKLASVPYQFGEVRHQEGNAIIIPCHTGERREYIPIGFLQSNEVIHNSAFAIYDADLWLFGLLSSKMHVLWVKTIAGRIREDTRYSAAICYNNFPFPQPSKKEADQLNSLAEGILLAREKHPSKTIAQLYDPKTMPSDLLAAHRALDEAVEACFRSKPFASDDERIAHLFKLYEKIAGLEPAESFQTSLFETREQYA
jgi:hypothetical protein